MPPGGRPHIAFPKSRGIHFARFAILTDPDRGPGRARLLFASVYDGTLDAHLAELVGADVGPRRDLGTAGGLHGARQLRRVHEGARPRAGGVLHRVPRRDGRRRSRRRSPPRAARAARDAGKPATHRTNRPAARPTRPPHSRVSSGPRRIVVDVVRAVARHGFSDVYRGTLRILACLDRYPVFRFVNRLTGNRLPPRRSPFSSVAIDTVRRAGAARARRRDSFDSARRSVPAFARTSSRRTS